MNFQRELAERNIDYDNIFLEIEDPERFLKELDELLNSEEIKKAIEAYEDLKVDLQDLKDEESEIEEKLAEAEEKLETFVIDFKSELYDGNFPDSESYPEKTIETIIAEKIVSTFNQFDIDSSEILQIKTKIDAIENEQKELRKELCAVYAKEILNHEEIDTIDKMTSILKHNNISAEIVELYTLEELEKLSKRFNFDDLDENLELEEYIDFFYTMIDDNL